ncbi:MAG TPA: encapsulin [Polyangiaceae bacterium]|nr:encapsulin [Polyangiaceae bacterium]
MNERIAQLPWSDQQWDCINQAVYEEAARTRVAAKFLRPTKAAPTDVAVPRYSLQPGLAPLVPAAAAPAVVQNRLLVNSMPDVPLTTLSMLVYVRSHEAADPELQAAQTMFRRAAALIARAEDALMFNGRALGLPIFGAPPQVQVTGALPATQDGLVRAAAAVFPAVPPPPLGVPFNVPRNNALVAGLVGAAGSVAAATGAALVAELTTAITLLKSAAYSPPYALVLANDLYEAINTPAAASLTSVRPTIQRLLEDGPLLHSDLITGGWGVLVSYDRMEVEQVVASDIGVRFLYVSEEPRFVFRVSVRTALRVRDWEAIVNLNP